MGDHPCTFATLTAPSFGAVHGTRQKGLCRARRDHPVCPHGRPLWCTRQHRHDDPRLGEPLCADCYDYTAHVVWQGYAPELWRRFTIALQRDLACRAGLTVASFCEVCKISYSKVVEFQARGVIHVHVPIRLDGPAGPDGPAPWLGLSTADLEDSIKAAAGRVQVMSAPLGGGEVHLLRWGTQVDTRAITGAADREGHGGVVVHPEQVASDLGEVSDQGHGGLRPSGARPERCARARYRRQAARRTDHCHSGTDRLENEAYGLLLSISARWATAVTRSPSPAPTR